MHYYLVRGVCLLALGIGCVAGAAAEQPTWQAGVAREAITPREPMWMSGYGSRDHAAEGTLHDLWAKALVLSDDRGGTVVLITLDLVGIDRGTAANICQRLATNHGLAREQIAICCSHTHTGPVVGQNLRAMLPLDPRQMHQMNDYTTRLIEQVVEVVGRAWNTRQPAQVAWGQGQATFAVNRRQNPEAEVEARRAQGTLVGPVDHDVPVMAVRRADGQLLAIVAGYACHATVLSFYQWSGDYPGFMQLALEQSHPGAVAMFWAGCGADQNPLPRRTPELAEHYGRQLAAAVEAVLAAPMAPARGPLAAHYAEVALDFASVPDRAYWEAEAASGDRFVAHRAQLFLAELAAGRALPSSYPYPVQCWRLDPDLDWVLLGGEVVVDFSLRLKRARQPQRLWVAGYANDVMAYIPSRRVLAEGGYEGATAMIYYGLPGAWADSVEERIVEQAAALLLADPPAPGAAP